VYAPPRPWGGLLWCGPQHLPTHFLRCPRKCRFNKLLGNHAAPGDTAVVGVAIEHVYRIQGYSGKMKEYTKDFIISPDGKARCIDN
jgi:hypothetical protein